MTSHDYTITFNAMCLWEELLENPETYPCVEAMRSNVGVCEVRDRVITLAHTAETVWGFAREKGYDSPFDFEFVPLFLKFCTNATSKDADDLQSYSMNPEMAGELIAMMDEGERLVGITRQAMQEIALKGSTVWTPEKIRRTGA